MISHASARFTRISPRKARVVADLVRGRVAAEALQLLEFTPQAGAPILKKLINSAIANARHDHPELSSSELFISRATVDKGPSTHMRRWRPRAMGRATRILKGVSHIHIELDVR